ncbi:MAG: DegT/DnrJ/EryC1/StrS family aminotransferase [Acidobacteriota bacterium]|nr:DegT/DnrJ/EryC1/StrS family aminotransferase [Acidobacteriota bacterium]
MTEKLALDGGTPVRSEPWARWPVWTEKDEQAVVDAIRSGKWGVGGTRVPELERRFAELHGARYGVTCCNGTIALQIALVAAGIQAGDEVITTPYTFMATAMAALAIGAVPVFVDIQEGTHNIDPDLIEAAITERTRAIYPVHIGGRPADMDRILEIAERRGLVVVEDAAQAWLAEWRGRGVGALGAAGTFSFQSSKNFSSGEGGIVLTNDEAVFQRAWSYHNCGRKMGGDWYDHVLPGLNYRLSELQAAILLSSLDRLVEQQQTRRRAMAVLEKGLAEVEGILVPDTDERITAHACHIFMARLDTEKIPVDSKVFAAALQAEGLPAHPGYTTPLYKQDFWKWFGERSTGAGKKWKDVWPRPYDSYDLPVCEKLSRSTIWVKQDVLLAGPEAMEDVIAAFAKVAAAARAGEVKG